MSQEVSKWVIGKESQDKTVLLGDSTSTERSLGSCFSSPILGTSNLPVFRFREKRRISSKTLAGIIGRGQNSGFLVHSAVKNGEKFAVKVSTENEEEHSWRCGGCEWVHLDLQPRSPTKIKRLNYVEF